MRGFIVIVAIVLLTPAPAAAQGGYPRGLRPAQSEPRFELSPFVNYQWGGHLDVSYVSGFGTIDMEDTEAFGAALDVAVRPGAKAELYYSYQPTTMRFRSSSGVQETVFDMGVHYMHMGGIYEMDRGSAARPFGLFSLGTTLFDPQGATPYGSEWRFSMRL